jgi:hypothetical protein
MIRTATAIAFATLLVTSVVACGSKNHGLDIDASQNGDGNTTADAPGNGSGLDARTIADGRINDANLSGCLAGHTQCSDTCDNDNDGYIDGADPECTGAIDNNEGSFATGIPGDNIDTVKQDCFFDGNSGSGDDGCDIHICCILSDPNCAKIYNNPPFDPNKCTQSQTCLNNCKPLVPPGCDCFGCCTVCDAQGCSTIYTNPAVAPNCDQASIHDPLKCPACTQNTQCENPCGGQTCVLCPGQDPSTLPPSCGGTSTCPAGSNKCSVSADCGANMYCSNGCCIAVVN